MGKHMDQYMHRIVCQILLASSSAAGAKSDSAEKKLQPPPPNRLQIPKVVTISRQMRHCPPIRIGRRREVARREKARLLCPVGPPPIPSFGGKGAHSVSYESGRLKPIRNTMKK